MNEQLQNVLNKWQQTTTDKQKLQHTYLVLLMAIVFIAGLVSLFDGSRSRQLMYVALALITTLVTNFLVWSLLKTTVLDRLPKTTNRAVKPQTKTR